MAHRHGRDDGTDPMSGGKTHALGGAGRTNAASFARERDQEVVPASITSVAMVGARKNHGRGCRTRGRRAVRTWHGRSPGSWGPPRAAPARWPGVLAPGDARRCARACGEDTCGPDERQRKAARWRLASGVLDSPGRFRNCMSAQPIWVSADVCQAPGVPDREMGRRGAIHGLQVQKSRLDLTVPVF